MRMIRRRIFEQYFIVVSLQLQHVRQKKKIIYNMVVECKTTYIFLWVRIYRYIYTLYTNTIHILCIYSHCTSYKNVSKRAYSYKKCIKVEGRHNSYNNYNGGEKNCIRYFRLATIRFTTHFNAHTHDNNIHC